MCLLEEKVSVTIKAIKIQNRFDFSFVGFVDKLEKFFCVDERISNFSSYSIFIGRYFYRIFLFDLWHYWIFKHLTCNFFFHFPTVVMPVFRFYKFFWRGLFKGENENYSLSEKKLGK